MCATTTGRCTEQHEIDGPRSTPRARPPSASPVQVRGRPSDGAEAAHRRSSHTRSCGDDSHARAYVPWCRRPGAHRAVRVRDGPLRWRSVVRRCSGRAPRSIGRRAAARPCRGRDRGCRTGGGRVSLCETKNNVRPPARIPRCARSTSRGTPCRRRRAPRRRAGSAPPDCEMTANAIRTFIPLERCLYGVSRKSPISAIFLTRHTSILSSGMKVVAFAVISRLEEPIILVDEVLHSGRSGLPRCLCKSRRCSRAAARCSLSPTTRRT